MMKLSDELKNMGFFEYLNMNDRLTVFSMTICLFSGMFFLPLYSVFTYGFELGLIPIFCFPSFFLVLYCYAFYSDYISCKNHTYSRVLHAEIKKQNRLDEIKRKLGKVDE